MIRQANERDLNDILEIYNHAILNTTAIYTYKPQTLEERRLWFDNKVKDGYPVYVYEENEMVIGFSTYGSFRAFPAYKYTIEHSVYVKDECGNRGIGTSLLNEVLKDATRREYATIVAGIDSANEKSIKMHEKLGFQHSGTIKRAGYKFGKWLDLTFLQLNLEGPQTPSED
jgi:phosphinothricin acetyltransferase